eukprot:1477364-Lingulodinium_polyedra.AAC.1
MARPSAGHHQANSSRMWRAKSTPLRPTQPRNAPLATWPKGPAARLLKKRWRCFANTSLGKSPLLEPASSIALFFL